MNGTKMPNAIRELGKEKEITLLLMEIEVENL